ncbi:ribosomal maturation YjgA family protein [Paenibacillus sp. Marseille-Q7038]
MKRIILGITCAFLILLGLTLRSAVPFIGDFLWAALIFCLFSFVFLNAPHRYQFFIPLLFCYFIEFTQLYHAPWINMLRENRFIQLILGQGVFGVWDLIAYTSAILVSYVISVFIEQKAGSKQKDTGPRI